MGYINNGTWVAFKNFDFGTGVAHASIEVATPNSGGTILFRTGASDGPVIGSVNVTATGSFTTFRVVDAALTGTVSGFQDLYLTFSGGGGYLFDTRGFWFSEVGPNLKLAGSALGATEFDLESHPGASPVVANDGVLESIEDNSWVAYTGFNFGSASNRIEIEGAAAGKGGRVELRMDAADGPVIGGVDISHTGSWTRHRVFSAMLTQPVSGTHDLFLRFVDSNASNTSLFRLKRLSVFRSPPASVPSTPGRLNVYPPVPGLTPSPYYRFSVQKMSALNALTKQAATNWLEPFAWFTKCVDKTPANEGSAYFEEFIGSWSHTYCNFELDPQTPVVVKITRLNQSGAPSGPIQTAVAHPAHLVTACEVINGEVYVTMSKPSLIAVDIDGQMDTRDAPRAIPDVWWGNYAPYSNEMNGSHGVTIFANPVIEDKPLPTDPDVFEVEPGTLPPRSGSWTTLYFKPGIHKLSVDAEGNEREWDIDDPLPLLNGKKYYIPGDAIVYGNLSDSGDNLPSTEIRVFGHGTLCGSKIPHFYNFTKPEYPLTYPDRNYLTQWRLLPEEHNGKLRMLSLSKANNCHFEGVTLADPPEHGFRIYGEGSGQNSLRWVKNISWRVNNDGASVNGRGVIEDCFFRHQDDALYVDGTPIRRCVFWSDVNGIPLRCDFITRSKEASNPSSMTTDLIVEDCDIIYARAIFPFGANKDVGVIAMPESWSNTFYDEGTPNTAQHLVFRNIRVTDPRPQRYLFGFQGNPDNPAFMGWAGIRFENIDYRHPHTWGWKNRILGTASGPARFWSFGNVTIAGQPFNAAMLADPLEFETDNVSDMIFKGPNFTLTSSASGNGSIASSPVGNTFVRDTEVQVTAIAKPGFVFLSWGGALAGSTDNPATLVMNENKSVTATFTVGPTGGSTMVSQINCGGPAYTAGDGTAFQADGYFNGGATYSSTSAISGTLDDALYQTERYGGSFGYDIPLANGEYEVTLKFAEIFFNSAGSRTFNIAMEGATIIGDLDVWARVGKNVAFDEKFVVTVNDGQLDIDFNAISDNAKIAAIQVARLPSPLGSYATWAASYANHGNPDEDYDKDGMSNGIEYFMGKTEFSFTPNPTIVGNKVTWPKNPSALVEYFVQTSANLTDWVTVSSGVVDHGTSVDYTVPQGDANRFVRLKVMVTP